MLWAKTLKFKSCYWRFLLLQSYFLKFYYLVYSSINNYTSTWVYLLSPLLSRFFFKMFQRQTNEGALKIVTVKNFGKFIRKHLCRSFVLVNFRACSAYDCWCCYYLIFSNSFLGGVTILFSQIVSTYVCVSGGYKC